MALTTMYNGQTNSPATTLASSINSTATSITVSDASALPAVPFPLTIGINSTNSETVLVTAKSSNTLTVTRGWDGTASSWAADTPCARVFTARDLNTVQSNITALNTTKAEQSDVTDAMNDLWSDIYANSASGPIATFYRTVGGLPVDDLTIDINPVQAGTGDPSPTNVRAISGWTGATIGVNNKNLFANPSDGYFDYRGEIYPANGYYLEKYTPQYILVGDNTEITFHAENDTSVAWWACLCYYDESKTFLSRPAQQGTGVSFTATFTLPAGTKFVRLTSRTYGSTKIQYEFGSEFTGFVTPSYTETSISWNTETGTVYGGTLDVTTGVLTVTHKMADLGDFTYTATTVGSSTPVFQTNAIADKKPGSTKSVCSIYKCLNSDRNDLVNNNYAIAPWNTSNNNTLGVRDDRYSDASALKTAITGQKIVYELDTPLTYQLTPAQVTSLLGENNVWADTGNAYVTFGADIKSYIDDTVDDKQDEITASGILKGDGAGGVSAAVAGTDYQAPLTAGTDYQTPLAEEKLQYYGVCSTAASTQAKTVTIDGITALTTGLEIRVKMTNAQTYNGTPTLNVNSLGAKNIMQHGSTAAVRYQWQAGEVVSLTYDGTYWVLENNSLATTTYFGLTRLSSATDSTAEDSAATPKAVKTVYDLAAAAVPNSAKGAASGVATLDANTKVTAAQASSYMVTVQADTTLAASHAGCMLVCSGDITITIPSTLAAGTEIEILNYGVGTITVAAASGVTLNGQSAGSFTVPDQYTSGVLKAISASQWVIQGAIS